MSMNIHYKEFLIEKYLNNKFKNIKFFFYKLMMNITVDKFKE